DKVIGYINDEVGSSYTILDSTNGIGFLNRRIIMCVVPSIKFIDLRNKLTKLDKNISIVSNDCYSLDGGTVDSLLVV
nr:hypothetical protein [Bacilli bacterium]